MDIDLGSAASIHDPAATFGAWITDGDVHWSDAQRGWAVLGHAAVAEAFRDAETLSADRITVLERVAADRPAQFRMVVELLSGWMIFRDPPAHTRLRTPVRAAFTAGRVAALAPLVESIVDEAFDAMDAHASGGELDLTRHVARPVPALVIGALLGVAADDRPRLQQWSDGLAPLVFSLSPRATPPAGVVKAADAFRSFFGPLVDRARGSDDGSLIAHIAELSGTMEAHELVGMCTMLLFAGHETTTSLIQNMAATLLDRPELADLLRADESKIPGAVDEFLRVQGPARTMVRKVARDHRRGPHQLRTGDNVFLSIAGANHDPRVFEDAALFDVGRDPNPHLGFGWGLHHCLGAPLARLEAAAVLRALVRRHQSLEPCGPVPPLRGSTMGFHRDTVRLRASTARRTGSSAQTPGERSDT